MSILHFTADEHDAAEEHYSVGYMPDLDGAFNDGFRGPAGSVASSVRRWFVIAWSVAAWCAGTVVMAKGLIDAAPAMLNHLQHWLG